MDLCREARAQRRQATRERETQKRQAMASTVEKDAQKEIVVEGVRLRAQRHFEEVRGARGEEGTSRPSELTKFSVQAERIGQSSPTLESFSRLRSSRSAHQPLCGQQKIQRAQKCQKHTANPNNPKKQKSKESTTSINFKNTLQIVEIPRNY